jgi:ubiquinone/menaquinone biosynthesis C-methylase UbiE
MVKAKDGYLLDPMEEDHLGLYEDKAKSFFSARRLREIKKRVDAVGDNKSVLELGCGHGVVLDYVYNPTNTYTGIDINPNSVEIAKKRNEGRENVTLRAGDVMKVDCPDNTADIVICTEVLEHLPDPEATLKEIRRVLKPGGIFVSTVPFEWFLVLIRTLILPVRLMQGRGIFVDAHLHYFNYWSYKEFLAAHFAIDEIRHAEFGFRILAVCRKDA